MILVVGPSGAGKDTLIAHARQALADDALLHFPRRLITRAADPALEDHDSIDMPAFDAIAAGGGFALHWKANGLGYAIPGAIEPWFAEGAVIVANVSRAVLALALEKYGRVAAVHVTAPAEVLAARLAARGREQAGDIAQRLARAPALDLPPELILSIDNGGTIDDGAAPLIALLRALGARDRSA